MYYNLAIYAVPKSVIEEQMQSKKYSSLTQLYESRLLVDIHCGKYGRPIMASSADLFKEYNLKFSDKVCILDQSLYDDMKTWLHNRLDDLVSNSESANSGDVKVIKEACSKMNTEIDFTSEVVLYVRDTVQQRLNAFIASEVSSDRD